MENRTMVERNMSKVSSKQRVVKILVMIAIYTFLIVMAIIVLFPFYWMLNSSLKHIDEFYLPVPTPFPMKYGVQWVNYVTAFQAANIGILFINTVYVGVVSTVLSLIITVLSAFAFARLEFKGKNILFAALLIQLQHTQYL